MFGELDDSDIYVSGQNENFEEPLMSEFAEDDASADDMPVFEPDTEELASPEQPKTDKSKLLIYVLVLILLVVGAAGAYFYKMKASQQEEVVVIDQETSEMGDFFYDKAKSDGTSEETTVVDVELTAPAENKPDNAAQTQDANKEIASAEDALSPIEAAREKEKKELENKKKMMQNKNKQVVIPVSNGGRANPFMPYNSALANAKPPEFDLIPPPLDVPEMDPLVDNMVSTKISGIMYDSQRPSAIINCGGSDHLVHKGDTVQGYRVIDITKDRVVLKYGSNVFRATVGQAIGGNGVVFNEVSNLNRQFGGAYSKTPSNVIEINGSN